MTASTLGRAKLRALFAQFSTAFRLETRAFYQDGDNGPFQRWLAGAEPDD